MYAVRKLAIKQWERETPEERYTVQVLHGGKPVRGIDPTRISVVGEEVMHWRKADHIHQWFVDNVMDGNDPDSDKEYYIGCYHLKRLLEVCERVLEASDLVPGEISTSKRSDDEDAEDSSAREPGYVVNDAGVARSSLPRSDAEYSESDEYDAGYIADVKATKDWATRMLAETEAGVPGQVYYSFSW